MLCLLMVWQQGAMVSAAMVWTCFIRNILYYKVISRIDILNISSKIHENSSTGEIQRHKTSLLLIISQHWFRWWLGAVRYQTIAWASVDSHLCHHMASLGCMTLSPAKLNLIDSAAPSLLTSISVSSWPCPSLNFGLPCIHTPLVSVNGGSKGYLDVSL